MKRQTLIFAALLSGICFQSFGQSFKDQFNTLVTKKDTAGQRVLLANWKAANNNDPEFYVASFNFYFTKSRTEYLSIDKVQKGKESIQISDSAKAVGYLNSNIEYGNRDLTIALSYADTGIYKFPTRLDMRFGKIYVMGKIKDYERFTVEIIKTVNYSDTIKNKWSWTDGKPLKDPEKFLLSSVHSYVVQLYDTNNDSLLDNMKRISETVLKYYPNHIESLSDLAIVYILHGEYDKALVPLLKAEKLNPTDYIVLNNIADAYKNKGDKPNAIKYYELTMKYGDDEIKEYAKKQIELLKEK